MTKARIITAYEWQRVDLPEQLDSSANRERLFRVGRTAVGDVFRLNGRHLHARNLVGLVQAGSLQVQILPKIHVDSTEDESSELLLGMFLRSGLPVRYSADPAQTEELGGQRVFEPLFRYAALKLNELLVPGAPHRYCPVDSLSETIRGRVQIRRLAYRKPGTEYLVPIRHAPLMLNNPLTRVLGALAREILGLTRSLRTDRILRQAIRNLGPVPGTRLTPELVSSLHLSRFEERWRWMIELARLLANGRVPDAVTPGRFAGLCLVFPLDQLFERLVHSVCRRLIRGTRSTLAEPGSAGCLLTRGSDGLPLLSLKPDLVFRDAGTGTITLVADAKWKRLNPSRRGLGLDRQDLHQILAYQVGLGPKHALLFFPASERTITTLRLHELHVPRGDYHIDVLELPVVRLLNGDPAVRAGTESAIRDVIRNATEANAGVRGIPSVG